MQVLRAIPERHLATSCIVKASQSSETSHLVFARRGSVLPVVKIMIAQVFWAEGHSCGSCICCRLSLGCR